MLESTHVANIVLPDEHMGEVAKELDIFGRW